MKTIPIDKFIELSTRTAIRSILTKAEKGEVTPEMVDRLVGLMRELRKPGLDELSTTINGFAERLAVIEDQVKLLGHSVNMRQPTPRQVFQQTGGMQR